jgi:hypothetical protein
MQVICESVGWRSEVGSEASDRDGSSSATEMEVLKSGCGSSLLFAGIHRLFR